MIAREKHYGRGNSRSDAPAEGGYVTDDLFSRALSPVRLDSRNRQARGVFFSTIRTRSASDLRHVEGRPTVRRPLVILVSLLITSACAAAPTESPTPVASPTPGQASPAQASTSPNPSATAHFSFEKGRTTLPEYGFAVTLADGWIRIFVDYFGELDGIPDSVVREVLFRGLSRVTSIGGIFAIDSRGETVPAASAANVLLTALPAGSRNLATIVDADVAALNGLQEVNKPIKAVKASLPAGEAFRLSYSVTLRVPSGEKAVLAIRSYYLLSDDRLVAATFTVLDSVVANYEQQFADMAESIELLP